MADIINIGNEGFASARRSQYVDKSGLIGFVNRTLCSEDKFICVTRARRFGKSMAAKMLCAYYDQSCSSDSLFSDLQKIYPQVPSTENRPSSSNSNGIKAYGQP